MSAAPVGLRWTVYCPEYGTPWVVRSTLTVAAESEPRASILAMCRVESTVPTSGGAAPPDPGPGESTA